MSSVKLFNPKAFENASKKLTASRQKKFERALTLAVEYIIHHTPVWSGNTLSNYRFSSIRPTDSYTPIEKPEEFGEINREEAERKALANFARAKKDPDRPFFISNNTVYKDWRTGEELTFADLEHGNVSKRVPPQGIFFGAQMVVSAKLGISK